MHSFTIEPDAPDSKSSANWEDVEIEGDWLENYSDLDILVWPGQDLFLHSEKKKVGLFTGAGYGKCLRKSTKVLRFSGEVTQANQITLGDLLMGPDSKPRKVLEIHTGSEVLYEVVPVKGEPFRVTGNHRLTLSRSYSKHKTGAKGERQDVAVIEWLGWSDTQKKEWKMVRTGVDFRSGERQTLSVEPYFLGVLLGDGSMLTTPNVTTMDQVIRDEVYRQADIWNGRVVIDNKGGNSKASTYYIRGSEGSEGLTAILKRLGLWGHRGGTKFIPDIYKLASREDRLQLLAGLMDTDGSNNRGCYDYISKSKTLADDIVFVARSLGFDARSVECRKGCQTGAVGTYYRVGINGPVSQIPARLRPIPERGQVKDVLHTGFSVRRCTEPEEYVGFTLDGDHRFLLGDFTITHNSDILIQKALKHSCAEDGWWEFCHDWKSNPIKYLMGAPQNKYLVTRLIPGFRGRLAHWEKLAGRSLTKPTGKHGNGFFESASERRQEMANGVTFYFYSLHNEESAVAADTAFVGVDEGTMLKNQSIWNRAQQRCRDPRGNNRIKAVVGTPEKGAFLYDDFFDSNDNPLPDVDVFTDSSLNNPLLDDSFFSSMEGANEVYIDAQVMGKWVKGIGGQRFATVFAEERHLAPMNIGPHQKEIRFDIGWDPGSASGQVVIMYQSLKRNKWYLVDEIVIQGSDTRSTCHELIKRGYNKTNIRRIFMDPKDATKHKSTSPKSDAEIVYEVLGIRPRVASVPGMNAYLRTRLDALADVLKMDKLIINEALRKRNRKARGVINAINNFALEVSEVDEGRFIDKCTRETILEWKHSIDAIHYVLMNYEHEIYRKVLRNQKDKMANRHARFKKGGINESHR